MAVELHLPKLLPNLKQHHGINIKNRTNSLQKWNYLHLALSRGKNFFFPKMKDAFAYCQTISFEDPQRQSPIQRVGIHLPVIAVVRFFCPYVFVC